MSNTHRYVPILKGRQAEFASLEQITPITQNNIHPLIELSPSGDKEDAKSISESIGKCASKLGKAWANRGAFLDAVHLDIGTDLGGGHGAVYTLCRNAEEWNVRATPVLRLDDPTQARTDVSALHEQLNRGVCIRLVGEDLDSDPEDLDDAFDSLFKACGMRRQDADLVLDAGAIDNEVSARGAARIVASLLRDIEHIDDWRSITVAGGAFPVDLSAYDPWVIGERPRFDADMWAHVINRRRLRRAPDFGDYAVAHPLLTTGVAFAPAPQLRYTTADHWLILKARRNVPEGNEQFYTVCEKISNDPRFVGASLGNADKRIADAQILGPGNATTWRQIGTTHHIDFVVRRLTTLGEP